MSNAKFQLLKPVVLGIISCLFMPGTKIDLARAGDENYEDIYNEIKELEGIFDVPTPSITIQMGTFDASTGTFEGRTTSTRYESAADFLGPIPNMPLRR